MKAGKFVSNLVNSAKEVALNPVSSINSAWVTIKKEAHHYYVGSKLLWTEIKMAKGILTRLVSGHGMTRRERLQLVRTAMDMFRLIPFAVFVIVPFMEFLLPVALKLFPNMLPSTFQDSLKKEELMKKELQLRLEIAGFLQETLAEMANNMKRSSKSDEDGASAHEVIDFIDKARIGEPLPNNQVLKIARFFKDELTLANIARPQLVTMCQYMGIKPFGADAFLRFQLRAKLRAIKEDDRRILWEGVESLTLLELREACQERGMRAHGLNEFIYKRQLREWLDLSIQKGIPISLLIMSRAFSLKSTQNIDTERLADSMSSLDSDVINEVVLAAANQTEENSVEIKKRRLESIEFQKEMIQDELEDAQDAMASSQKVKPGKDLIDESQKISVTGDTTSKLENNGNAQINTQNDSRPVELTLAEIEVLGDLARGSVVEREKIQLNLIKTNLKDNFNNSTTVDPDHVAFQTLSSQNNIEISEKSDADREKSGNSHK